MPKRALTRGIPNTYENASVKSQPAERFNLELARKQHRAYINSLKRTGLEVIELPADDRFPDCCFVEDCALLADGVALITYLGIESRRGEEEAVKRALSSYVRIETMAPPATLEGGDCLRIENRLYVGNSIRTNLEGIERVRTVFEPLGYEIVTVPVTEYSHLKCVCSYLGNGKLLLAENTISPSYFRDVEIITVPYVETYAANCLSVNGFALLSGGYPETKKAINASGFETITLETSEIKKAEGSLTCLSILF